MKLTSKPLKNPLNLLSRKGLFRVELIFLIFIGLFSSNLTACQTVENTAEPVEFFEEVEVRVIPLTGPVSDPSAEISGLAWYGDNLILLPQYPNRFDSHLDGSLFSIPKSEILSYLENNGNESIQPSKIDLNVGDLNIKITGFEGFESIGIDDDRVYLTIESRQGDSMLGYVVKGEISGSGHEIHLDIDSLKSLKPQADIQNFSDEAILLKEDQVMTFYETWGQNVNPSPFAHVFNLDLSEIGTLSLPNIEYRITDLTSLDENEKFWGINYLYPGDAQKLKLADDDLADRFGVGESHSKSRIVERLVEFRIQEDGIVLTDSPPIQMVLLDDGEARNWEGIVRLDELGFLLVTDKFPETILGFVPYP